jgi:hypothetical protein
MTPNRWRLQLHKLASSIALLAGAALLALSFTAAASAEKLMVGMRAQDAGQCHRQVVWGPGAAYIAEYKGMSCRTARKIALTAEQRGTSQPIEGLRCRRLSINAGGGGAVCAAGRRRITLYFE